MTPVALLFLVISIVVVWGGLVASILHLRAHPADDGADPGVDVTGEAGQPGQPGVDGTATRP
ncbi:methionine/alanine import family NSS transporter small subunit [uncultured Cellulomonas sp.]|uniref:methionine/alanine import family NSS transporter small subunit n=1 Tax=uncultured Cellulomonas sp. TaxID=189682 RepID=UPI002634FC51|nr:methionine/alanine import family NSS transporter small subunit [uncultured Cellulomonas sp.]